MDHSPPSTAAPRPWPSLAVLAGLALLPAASLLAAPWGSFLADPGSELPVRLWCWHRMTGSHLLGGIAWGIGAPWPGSLNQPDLAGTVMMGAFSPVLGDALAYDLMVVLILFANLLAAWWLARRLLRDDAAAVVCAAVIGLTPLLLVYPLASAVTDLLHLWPWLLALGWGLEALARGRWRRGLAAGLMVGLGVIICPYTAVMFAAAVVPGGAWFLLAGRRALWPAAEGEAPGRWRGFLAAGGAIALGAALLGGSYLGWTHHLMAAAGSQMSAQAVAATRNVAPYPALMPDHFARMTSYLADWVATGKGALIQYENVSRFYRAFSPGLLALALAVLGLVAGPCSRRVRVLWALVAGFMVLASTGPYLPLTAASHLERPMNPAFLAIQHGVPGGAMILEPFRYALVAVVALGLLAGLGAAALGRWLGPWPVRLLPLLVVAEVAFLSPVPFPLPTTTLTVSPAMARLDEVLGPGAVIELPFFLPGGRRYAREHFTDQLVHGRPIPDQVLGEPPRYFIQNPFLTALIAAERPEGEGEPLTVDPTHYDDGIALLPQDRFAGIVVDPGAYRDAETAARVLEMLSVLGPALPLEDRVVFRITGQGAPRGDQGSRAGYPPL